MEGWYSQAIEDDVVGVSANLTVASNAGVDDLNWRVRELKTPLKRQKEAVLNDL